MVIYFAKLIISSEAVNIFLSISKKVFRPANGSLEVGGIKVAFEFIMI